MSESRVVPGCKAGVTKRELFAMGTCELGAIREAEIRHHLEKCDSCAKVYARIPAQLPPLTPNLPSGTEQRVRTTEYTSPEAGGTRSSGRRVIRKSIPE